MAQDVECEPQVRPSPRVPAPGSRWHDRPLLAVIVRVAIFVVPLVASVTLASMVAQRLPHPASTSTRIAWWVAVLSASLAVCLLVDRLARRLLPLATLLKLSLVFPDHAPSRVGVALRAGSTKRLHERALLAAERGDEEPATAARTILSLAATLNAHDRGTRGHSERVRAYADLIAEELCLDPVDRDRLRWAALLHDVGKLGVPAHTLNTTEPLTEHDWEVLRRHPEEGARIATPLREWLGPWATAIEQHHERYDGRGYPRGLSGHELSLAARIVAVADSYDAMTSVRSYNVAVSPDTAREELARQAGSHFDPIVVRAFLNVAIGRLRWVMGPLAFFGGIPIAIRFRSIADVVGETARTVAVGTATLVATVGVVQSLPAREDGPAPARRPATVLGQFIETAPPPALEPGVRATPLPVDGEQASVAPEELAPGSIDASPAATTGADGTTDAAVRAASVVPPASPAPRQAPADPPAQATPPAAAASRPPPSPPAEDPSPRRPPERATEPAPPPRPEQQPEPEPEPTGRRKQNKDEDKQKDPAPACRDNPRSGDHGQPCPPPRWGHTDEPPPHGKAKGHDKHDE